jgi:hypothetical protein
MNSIILTVLITGWTELQSHIIRKRDYSCISQKGQVTATYHQKGRITAAYHQKDQTAACHLNGRITAAYYGMNWIIAAYH